MRLVEIVFWCLDSLDLYLAREQLMRHVYAVLGPTLCSYDRSFPI